MAAKTEEDGGEPRRSGKKPLIIGLIMALCGAGGGFYAVHSGLLPTGDSQHLAGGHDSPPAPGAMPDVAYVPVAPLVISLGDGMTGRHLRFRAELEVPPAHQGEVERLMPRVVDVLNSYLRALDLADLTDSAALLDLRAQMLRRLQVVTGRERISDLLIMEFVLN